MTPDLGVESRFYDKRSRRVGMWMGRGPGSSQGTAALVFPKYRPKPARAAVAADAPAPRRRAVLRSDRTRNLAQRSLVTSERVERRLREKGLGPRWIGNPPSGFTDVRADSRAILPGELFCAVPGTRFDGHAFVADAAAAGAAAAVVERRVETALPLLQVADAHQAVAHLGSLFRGDPAAGLRLVGVTGTNGKSTTAWLIRWLLSDLGPAAAVGTLGVVEANGRVRPGSLTTPDPVGLADALGGLRDAGVIHVALEASSHALDQRRVDALAFAAVVFTSFSREHLEYHADLSEYRAAKLRILDLLAPGGLCAANADEPAWDDVRPANGRLVRYGTSAGADVRAEGVELRSDGSRWSLVTPGVSGDGDLPEVELPFPGDFNVLNALAAASVALDAGMAPERIARRLGAAPPVPGRMEVLTREPALVLRDYAHSPDALERALTALRGGVVGRIIAVFGCGGDRDPGKRPIMGEIGTRLADVAIVTSDNPRSEDPASICDEIVRGLDPSTYELIVDRREAIRHALELADPGDVVVLLGKGHETYQILGDRTIRFDEKEIVEELLSGSGAGP